MEPPPSPLSALPGAHPGLSTCSADRGARAGRGASTRRLLCGAESSLAAGGSWPSPAPPRAHPAPRGSAPTPSSPEATRSSPQLLPPGPATTPPAAQSPSVAWQGWRWQGAEMVARAGRREKQCERQSRGVSIAGGRGHSPPPRRGGKCRPQGAGGTAEPMPRSRLSAGSGPGCSACVDPLGPWMTL